jgi:hypothetical protein
VARIIKAPGREPGDPRLTPGGFLKTPLADKETIVLQDARAWCAVVGFGIAVWLLVPQALGPRRPVVRPEDIPVMEYVCRETKEVFRLSATAPVLANPKTGKPTLVPAIYDARRKAWSPGPPLDVRQMAKVRRG